MSKSKNRHHHQNFQQDAFGEWKNLLENPFTFAEVLTKVIISSDAPNGFLKELEQYKLTATVLVKQSIR